MKEWFLQLSQRERNMLVVGSIIVIILLAYVFIWNPLTNGVAKARESVIAKQQLLHWMRRADDRIRNLQAAGFSTNVKRSRSLLVIAERSLSQHKLSNYVKQVQQPQDKQITLVLHKVPFDDLITWLQMLWKREGINVIEANVTKTDTIGAVDVKLKLQN